MIAHPIAGFFGDYLRNKNILNPTQVKVEGNKIIVDHLSI